MLSKKMSDGYAKIHSRISYTWATGVLHGQMRKRTGLLLNGLILSFHMKVKFTSHLEIKV